MSETPEISCLFCREGKITWSKIYEKNICTNPRCEINKGVAFDEY